MPNPERPYLNIIDTLHESVGTRRLFGSNKDSFKTDIGGTLALFAQMRIHLAQSAGLM